MSNITQHHQATSPADVSSQQRVQSATEDEYKKSIAISIPYDSKDITIEASGTSELTKTIASINALRHQLCRKGGDWCDLNIIVEPYDITTPLSEVTDTANSDDPLKPYQLIIPLLGIEFVGAPFCYEQMKPVFEDHKQIERRLRCVLLHTCTLEDEPFLSLRLLHPSCYLPNNHLPINSWSDKSKAYASIAKGIRKAIDDLRLR